jgi:hypothetical protein
MMRTLFSEIRGIGTGGINLREFLSDETLAQMTGCYWGVYEILLYGTIEMIQDALVHDLRTRLKNELNNG